MEKSQLLKSIAEKQWKRRCWLLSIEREQRLTMKELDAVKNAEHLSNLNDMLMGFEMLEEEPVPSQPQDDLFSELQGSNTS